MNHITYQVVEKYDSSRDYGTHIKKGIAKRLSVLKKGDTITTREFLKRYPSMLGHKANPNSNLKQVSTTLALGMKIGVLCKVNSDRISFRDFCKFDTVNYLKDQLRGQQYKNLKPLEPSGLSSTQRTYIYALYRFNNWLVGKEFDFAKISQTGSDTFRRTRHKVILEGLEHLLLLYQESIQSEPDFMRMIKKYLLDPIHVNKRAAGIKIDHAAIVAYFEKNDYPIRFKFDAKVKYEKNEEEKKLSLEDLMHILTVGRPTITQKAVFLCKFHRGLDTTTLCDRFNFDAWAQIVQYFGSDQHNKWDLSKCPVPVKVTRMKTNFTHLGFLDRDAIVALQKYLDYRYEKTGQAMREGEAIFLNSKSQPIRETWVRTSFFRLANTAQVQRRLSREGAVRYEKDSHELRDLLKSTLLDCGVRPDVGDHVIGHKPKDGYEKQALLYPESMRKEYSKASKRLNVFSNFSSFVKGGTDYEELQAQLLLLQEQIKDNERIKMSVEKILNHLKLDS